MIERLVVWGGNDGDQHSHRWIMRGFYENALKIGIDAYWTPDDPDFQHYVTPGSTVIAADVWKTHLPYVPHTDYILHNFDNENDQICQMLSDTPWHLLRLQVHTDDAFGEEWATFRHYDQRARILFQPWGADLAADEFMEPVFNPQSKDVVFVGAIWSDTYQGTELGNLGMIAELKTACSKHGLNFVHLTQVSPDEQLAAIRGARLAPAFAGGWQVDHNYLPCRFFKNIACGQLGVTNVPALRSWQEYDCMASIADEMDYRLSLNTEEWDAEVREQQELIADYTYEESLYAIDRALEAGR